MTTTPDDTPLRAGESSPGSDPHHLSENLGRSGHTHRDLTPEEMARMEEKIRQIEIAISLVLRIGVSVSVIVLGIGLGIMFSHHSAYAAFSGSFSYHALTSVAAHHKTVFPHSFGALGHSIALGQGRGIVVLGVLILILTPILRVAVGVISFMYEKDPPMTIVTLYVLGVLIASFFLAGA
jgi:uncharacterized membrane protein